MQMHPRQLKYMQHMTRCSHNWHGDNKNFNISSLKVVCISIVASIIQDGKYGLVELRFIL